MKTKRFIYPIMISAIILTGCTGPSSLSSNGTGDLNSDGKSVANIVVNNIRVQVLDEQTIRFEEKYNNSFIDDNTFFIPNRDAYKGVIYQDYKDDEYHYIEFNDIKIYIPLETEGFQGVFIERNGQVIYEPEMMRNNGNLPSPSQTPDTFVICDTPRIIIPETGYSFDSYENSPAEFEDFSGYEIQKEANDLYVLLPFGDAKKLRQSYVNLTGKSEMVRLANLGSWDSKYFAYSDKTAQEEIDNYKKYNLPLDNLVIDTDWRKSSGTGIGYDINTNLFPDMEGFLESVHSQNIEVMFNDHPEPVAGTTSLLDPMDIYYRNESLKSLLEIGLDTWWYDRNWTVALKSPTPSYINPETWGLYLYHDITKQHYQTQADNNEIYRRPVVMGNADNIYHGDYRGINNTASHRYSIQWTGDINADSKSLKQEIKDIIKSGIDAIPYMSSDLGGHNGNPSNELYTRWIQYGALSPIFRPHSSKYNQRYRQPWLYGDDALNISREYINLRYRLMALYYALAYENYQTGMPLIRSLEFNYPNDENARRDDEYLIGNNILFAPITDDVYNSIPSSWFVDGVNASYYNNTSLSGDPVKTQTYDTLDFSWGNSSPISGVLSDNFSALIETKIKPSHDATLAVKVDDGVRVYVNDSLVLDKFFANDSVTYDVIKLSKDASYDIKFEYYEAAGGAYLSALYKNESNLFTKSVYLPDGEWMNVFTGEIYQGKQTYEFTCDLLSSPLFVRLGSITPLVENASNTTEIDWNNITYDVYPSKNASDTGFVYEDDKETTAYKYNQNRILNYSYNYLENENVIVIKLNGSQGKFDGSECTLNKNYSIRYHLLEGMSSISKVTVNGKVTSMNMNKVNSNAFPFAYQGGSATEDVISIEFSSLATEDNEIKIYLNN